MVFTLKEMEEATGMFSDKNLIGKGGFGRVYRGVLKDGQIVAIKKMDLPTAKQADGEREFRVEIDILSRLDHPNLVTLIGYCADGKHRFVVYEFMPKGNLQDVLNGIRGEVRMGWGQRLRIALGAARGLAYLHSTTAVGVPVVHRDFKSSNILLSDHFEAKISDFGLAKLMPQDLDLYATTRVLGTFGYFDPEYALTGKLTLQSDVYAFGVVLLELLTGRRAIDLSQGPQDQNLIVKVLSLSLPLCRLPHLHRPALAGVPGAAGPRLILTVRLVLCRYTRWWATGRSCARWWTGTWARGRTRWSRCPCSRASPRAACASRAPAGRPCRTASRSSSSSCTPT
ncbi:hypothetical protein VPH35_083182 [Triticum aestivum]